MPFKPQKGLGHPEGPKVIRGTRAQIRKRVAARREQLRQDGVVDPATGALTTGLSEEEQAAELAAAQQAAIDEAKRQADAANEPAANNNEDAADEPAASAKKAVAKKAN